MSGPKEFYISEIHPTIDELNKHDPDYKSHTDFSIHVIEKSAYDKEHKWRLSAEKIYMEKAVAYDKAIEALKIIGSGPGYPLDECPKCKLSEYARNKLKQLGEL